MLCSVHAVNTEHVVSDDVVCGLGLNSEWDLCTPSGCVYVSDVSVCVCDRWQSRGNTNSEWDFCTPGHCVYVLDVSVCVCVRWQCRGNTNSEWDFCTPGRCVCVGRVRLCVCQMTEQRKLSEWDFCTPGRCVCVGRVRLCVCQMTEQRKQKQRMGFLHSKSLPAQRYSPELANWDLPSANVLAISC